MPHLRGDAFGDTRHLRHEHQGQREQRVTDARPQRARERDRQQHRGKGVKHVHGAHNQGVGFTARIAGDNADRPADEKGEHHRDNPHKQRQPGAENQP